MLSVNSYYDKAQNKFWLIKKRKKKKDTLPPSFFFFKEIKDFKSPSKMLTTEKSNW